MFIESKFEKAAALQRSAMFEIGHRAPLVRGRNPAMLAINIRPLCGQAVDCLRRNSRLAE